MNRPSLLALAASVVACSVLAVAGCAGSSPAKGAKPSPATGSYAFWPQFPDDPRIQFVKSFSSSEDVAPTKSNELEKIVFGKEVTQSELIDKPYGAAMRDGKIYVCDMRGKALTVLDLKKRQTRLVGVTGVNQLQHPVAVAVADDGMIYVADNERGSIFVFDAAERYSAVMGFPKFKPVGVAVHGDRLYASDLAGQCVVIFDRRSGSKIGTIGTVGDEDGQFRTPLGIATDKAGNVYVVDMMRCRVQKFSPDGKLISAFGSLGDYAGTFARPKHIAVDSDGVVYVVDASFQNVQMFDDQNRILMHFGAAGSFPGAMNLPAGIAVCEDSVGLFADQAHPGFAPKRLILVTNQFGPEKVSVYLRGDLRSGYTAKDLAASSIKVELGVEASPSEDRLKFAAPGGEAPPPEPGSEGAGDGGGPPEQKPPEPKPANPK